MIHYHIRGLKCPPIWKATMGVGVGIWTSGYSEIRGVVSEVTRVGSSHRVVVAVGTTFNLQDHVNCRLSRGRVKRQVFRDWQCRTIMGFLDATGNVIVKLLNMVTLNGSQQSAHINTCTLYLNTWWINIYVLISRLVAVALFTPSYSSYNSFQAGSTLSLTDKHEIMI